MIDEPQQLLVLQPQLTNETDPGLGYDTGPIDDIDPREWQVPPHCIPIHANVTTYNWKKLFQANQFDVIMMDPPWQLATANPTRGKPYTSIVLLSHKYRMLAREATWLADY